MRTFLSSPLGLLSIEADNSGIFSIQFSENDSINRDERTPYLYWNQHVRECIRQLEQYFNGTRNNFSLNLHLKGTGFQKKVWKAVMSIPFAETVSYKYIAEEIGQPKSFRAVGNANRLNKIAIIIPCHRVIGINGKLTGYAAGIHRKQWLLSHEKKYANK